MAAQRLKVLFITNWYPTKDAPVKAVWVREQAKAARLYDDIIVLHCPGPDASSPRTWRIEKEADEAFAEGVPAYRVWYRPSPISTLSYFMYLWCIFRSFRYIVNQGFDPDVIHVHIYDAGVPALLIGKLDGIPVVVSEHFSSFPRRSLGRLDWCKAWLAFRPASVVLPVSYSLQKAIEDYGIAARFRVIPNVVDTNLFHPSLRPREDANPKRILFVGQLAPVRGVAYLLEALSALRRRRDDWRLDIVGDGAARGVYERMAADLNLGGMITFCGNQARGEVAEFMSRADLLVVPGLTETFSVPAAEALASGVPVLATRCGGPEEFLSADTGMLVPPGDAGALCEGLEYMLDNLHRYSRERISRYARERFSPALVGGQLHEVYKSLSQSRRRNR